MKPILSIIAIAACIAFALLLLAGAVAYPMHIGEPSYYHAARVDCLMAAVTCAFVSITAAVLARF